MRRFHGEKTNDFEAAGSADALPADVDDLTRGLSDAQFTWRSAPDRWSISECLGHLLLTEQIALRVIDRLLDETRRAKNAAKVPFSTAQWFRFTLAHQRRHLWQARGVRNHPGFPVE